MDTGPSALQWLDAGLVWTASNFGKGPSRKERELLNVRLSSLAVLAPEVFQKAFETAPDEHMATLHRT